MLFPCAQVLDGSLGWTLRPGGRVVVHDDALMVNGRGSGDYVPTVHVVATVLSYTPGAPTALIAYGDRRVDTGTAVWHTRKTGAASRL